jgi:hypothetical protein
LSFVARAVSGREKGVIASARVVALYRIATISATRLG